MIMIEVLLITAVHLSILLIPGPDFFVLLANSLDSNHKRKILCAAGYSLATCTHGVLFTAGIGLLITQSPQAHKLLIVVGAIVFIATGIGIATSEPKSPLNQSSKSRYLLRNPFVQAFVVNFTNAKAIIYMLALFSQLVDNETENIVKATWLVYITAISFMGMLLLAFSFEKIGKTYLSAKFQLNLQKISGLLLIVFGIGLLISHSAIAGFIETIRY